MQAGLAKLWLDWGIEPDAALGFGVGQYTAACVAGGLCFKDALVMLVRRAKVFRAISAQAPTDDQAGDDGQLETRRNRELDEFESFADTLNFYPPNLPLVCSISGEVIPVHRSLGGSYWRQHCLAATLPEDAVAAFGELDFEYMLEIGPPATDDAMVATSLNKVSTQHLRSLTSNENVTTSMLSTLGRLFAAGAVPDFRSFDRHWKRNRVSLPTYPFQKKRYWITEIDQHVKQNPEPVESNDIHHQSV